MPKKVCLAITANHDKVDRDFMMHLVTLIKPTPDWIVSLRGEHIKSASLNEHVAQAANSGCSHIFFMDVDMNFPPWTLARLMSHNAPVVTGLYHLKSTPYSPIMGWASKEGYAVNGNGRLWKDDYCAMPRDQLVEIHWCGIGCLLVDMDVFNKIYYPPFKDIWNEEEGKRQKGHDVIFCEEVRKAGYRIFADTSVDVTHIGRAIVNRAWVETYHRCNMDQELFKTINSYSVEPVWWDEMWFKNLDSGCERDPRVLLKELTPRIPTGVSVIDLGCGDGQVLRVLKQLNSCDVYGMDFSETAIRILGTKGIKGEVADLRKYEANGRRAHTVIMSHVLEHMTEEHVDHVVKLASDMAEEQAFIIVPQEKRLWYEHAKLYDEEELRKAVAPHFPHVEVYKILGSKAAMEHLGYKYKHVIAHCHKHPPVCAEEAAPAATG